MSHFDAVRFLACSLFEFGASYDPSDSYDVRFRLGMVSVVL